MEDNKRKTNSNEVIEDKVIGNAKNKNLKAIIALAVIIVVFLLIVIKGGLYLYEKYSPSSFESKLSLYYKYLAEGKTNQIYEVVTKDFVDAINVKIKKGNYEIFSYELQPMIDESGKEINNEKRLLFTLLAISDKKRVCLLNYAYFRDLGDKYYIYRIETYKKGKNITK